MVVGAFPVAKLGALVLKQVSKPLANAAKRRARHSPFFRNYICMPPAQFYHWCEVKLKMWSMNLGKPVNIPKLNEAMAIDLGAELVGEGFMFIVAAGILVVEYVRSSRKETAKEQERIDDLGQMKKDLKELYLEKVRQEAQIHELVRLLGGKFPEASFNPNQGDLQSQIPEHHRDDYQPKEDDGGALAAIKGWVWAALDTIVPTEDNDNAKQKPHIIIIQTTSPHHTDDCECPPPNADKKTSNDNVQNNTTSESANKKPSK